jgi:hypothetical protein
MNAITRFPSPQPLRPIAPGLLWHHGCHCPGCGHRHWHVGRFTAECATCATALIIAIPSEGETECPAA